MALLLCAAAAACQGSPTPTAVPTPSATPAPSITASPAQTSPSAPSAAAITVVDDEGTSVTLAGPPHKVVSLTPATTELMFALGAGDRLVGRTDYDDYPAGVESVPSVATFQGVEMEKVVDIAPDLVLAGGNNFTHADDIARLRQLGIPVVVLYAGDLVGVQKDILLVGQAIGEEHAADLIAGDITDRMAEVKAGVAFKDRPLTFYEIGDDPALYGPAPDSFVADMVTLAGGDPITTTDPAVFEIPVERLVSLDPQVIVLGDAAYGVCPDQVASRPGWSGISAVKNGDVRPVDDTIVTRPGPRIGDGLAALALAIHPDAHITPPTNGAAVCAAPSPSGSPSISPA